MTAPQIVVELGERSAWFAGEMGVIHAAITTVKCRKQYDRKRRALGVPRAAADDVMAALELRFGGDVQVVEAIV
ncbi:hypothetical protein SAMN05443575_1343 [Jatrophihabitans endophyticus]|uniref:Uncharacterized protein n=1 Tax=Jatrophihabitans endophyticus TaxID=1206085 RepID=A0A1M5GZN0_9ACTN|nr:hypothetical protein [Jatrophihabitans endophyticus]SHG09118.1 hypothetical protein SAMN05443575_1343 [Jatrophihabitans endophyticus]